MVVVVLIGLLHPHQTMEMEMLAAVITELSMELLDRLIEVLAAGVALLDLREDLRPGLEVLVL
jgi:hypothetical protein